MSQFTYPEDSHRSNIFADRGVATYFHGRTQIRYDFNDLLRLALTREEARTTMLIQGAPGSGKTALLEELALDAIEKRWGVVKINFDDLYNPVHMAQTLGKPYVSSKQTSFKADLKLLGGGHLEEVAGDSSVSHVLEKINPKRGVVLILDEAQHVGDFKNIPDKKIQVTSTLNKIHNGGFPHPVILLAAGLGQTEEAFRLHGVSRFKGGCYVELGALDKVAESAVIKDWLVKEGDAKGDPTPWIDAIVEKTHGWPQHISAYGDAAAKQIQNDHGAMTTEGLNIVYQVGEERCEAYYKRRAKGISGKERSSLAKLVQNVPPEKGLYEEDIEKFLSREYNDPDKARGLFKKAVERGILHSQDELYSIPIPSMRSWLISNYIRERIEFPPSPQLTSLPSHELNSEIGSRER